MNTLLLDDPAEVEAAARRFGSQAVVASIRVLHDVEHALVMGATYHLRRRQRDGRRPQRAAAQRLRCDAVL